VRFAKAHTTPAEPWRGVLDALEVLGTDLAETEVVVHGTTLGLNAILEKRGARVGILATEGLRDVFLIGRGNVPEAHMYDFRYRRPPAIVRRRDTVGVVERIDARGNVVTPLDEESVRAAARYLVEEQQVDSIALCLLHSYRDPAHEQRAAEIVREAYPDQPLSVSSEVAREHREYERTSTTVLDAYIRPIFRNYLDRLETAVNEQGFSGQFLVMRSGGGAMTAAAARGSPTTTVLSGPAGGVIGASAVAQAIGARDVLSIDIGGTSLDAAVFDAGVPAIVHETTLGDLPLMVPVFDVRTMGAGGGSIARAHHGMLVVGPQSAGADPGPICYARGGLDPTTTDAAAVLGYLDPGKFLGGTMQLDLEAARRGIIERIGVPLGLDAERAAVGILSVMVAGTTGALRQVTVERGRDIGDYSMLAFGGAGPLFAPLIGREVRARQVVVPLNPAVFSAWGMLGTDVVEDVGRSVLLPLVPPSVPAIEAILTETGALAEARVRAQCSAGARIQVEHTLELRYSGQEHALGVVLGPGRLEAEGLAEAFGQMHRRLYGHQLPNPVQVLAARSTVRGVLEMPALAPAERGHGDATAALLGSRPAWDFSSGRMVNFTIYDRERLRAGDRLNGPALVEEATTASVLQADQKCSVNDFGHLVIEGSS
jgi:N-methylhydantoinase A